MTEEERLAALSMARLKSLEYATAVESPVKLRAMAITDSTALDRANMWARVAIAMRDGDADREPAWDGPDLSTEQHLAQHGVITR